MSNTATTPMIASVSGIDFEAMFAAVISCLR